MFSSHPQFSGNYSLNQQRISLYRKIYLRITLDDATKDLVRAHTEAIMEEQQAQLLQSTASAVTVELQQYNFGSTVLNKTSTNTLKT